MCCSVLGGCTTAARALAAATGDSCGGSGAALAARFFLGAAALAARFFLGAAALAARFFLGAAAVAVAGAARLRACVAFAAADCLFPPGLRT
jgi:hypothetical protein